MSLEAAMRTAMPVSIGTYDVADRPAGLIVVDEVAGFCTPGAGAMAPVDPNAPIGRMIERTDALARRFVEERRPILAFLDTHEPGRPEPPYPPHCERGTGEELLVDPLAWLAENPDVTLIAKDCINGFVGAMEPTFKAHGASRNKCVDWVNGHRLEAVVTVGICTDICVMDFVLTMLSARNHGLMPTLRDVVVLEPACATYDLPLETARARGLPDTAAHPRAETHHMGLYFMASRGAIVAASLAHSLEG